MSAVDPPSLASARPNILALPSATACRAVALLFALLSSGLYAGGSLFHALPIGDRWFHRVGICLGAFPQTDPASPGFLASGTQFQRCVDSVNTGLVVFQVVGAVLAVLGCAALTVAAPSVLVRRRRLHFAGLALRASVARVAQLADDAGLNHPPRVYVGPSSQRDAFTLGLPGRYAVSLPPALAIRSSNAQLFDPVVRHELQHIQRQDVLLAWSARTAGWVLLALLGVPVVHEVLAADFSLLPAYGWRAVLLTLTALLAAAAILRSREREADLGSVHTPAQRIALTGLLASTPSAPEPRWRSPLARHPTKAARIRTVDDPAVGTRVGFADGFTVALLSALTMPMITALLSDDRALSRWAEIGGPAIVGTLFGVTVGLALWREELARRASGRVGAPAGGILAGVFVGFLLGQTSSLATIGSPGLAGVTLSWSRLVSPVAATAVTAMCVGAAPLFADAAPRLTRRSAAALCVVSSATMFATTMWIAGIIEPTIELVGWGVVRDELANRFGTRGYGLATGVLAAIVIVMLTLARSRPRVPVWAFDGDAPTTWPLPDRRPGLGLTLLCAAAAGLGGGLVLIEYRVFAGAAVDFAHAAQRSDTYIWILALSGLAGVLALSARFGRRGLGAGLAASPLATAVAATVLTVNNTALGGPHPVTFFLAVGCRGLALGGVLIAVVAVPIVLLAQALGDARVARPRATPAWLAALVAAMLAVTFAAAALAARETLSPLSASASSDSSTAGGAAAQEVADYRDRIAPAAAQTIAGLDDAIAAINNGTTLSNADRALTIRTQLLTTTQQLIAQVSSLQLTVPAVRQAHQHLVTALTHKATAFEDFAKAFESGDAALLTAAHREQGLSAAELTAWQDAVATLH